MKTRFLQAVLTIAAIFTVAITNTIRAEESEYSKAEVAEMLANPLSFLWMMAMQSDTIFMDGDLPGADKVTLNRLTVMPVMPFQLTEEYKLMFRPWIPYCTYDLPWKNRDNFIYDSPGFQNLPTGIKDTDTRGGLGDMGFWAMMASQEGTRPPFIYGLGITTMFDTASKDQFGFGQNSIGPTALAFYVREKWVIGGILQHWWSYYGDDDRSDVNLTDFQYIIRYRINRSTSVGCTPNAQYNWESDSFTFPVGLGADKLVYIGKLPIKIGIEAYYYIESDPDELHNDWHLRFFAIPVLPSPNWTRRPRF